MTEHEKESAFLKAMLRREGSAEAHRLLAVLGAMEQDDRCVRRALRMAVLITMLAVAGIAYSAVLLPRFFHDALNVFTQIFSVLGLGSLIALAVFFAARVWYRALARRQFVESRRIILAWAQALSSGAEPAPRPPGSVGPELSGSRTPLPQVTTETALQP